MEPSEVGGACTTEVCNLSCVMCHFNGPNAVRLEGTVTVEELRKFASSVPPGPFWFSSTGDFLMDPNALEHLRTVVECGHQPCVLTNGQLLTPSLVDSMLEIGVREVSISVDAIEPENYRKIRRGGELSNILAICAYLRSQKSRYPDLVVSICNVMFKNTFPRQEEFVRFWSGKADVIKFQAEYYDTFKFRNTHFPPGERVDCEIRVFLLPTGQMSPCCAITAHQHNRNLDWLPHIEDTTPEEALQYFKKLYADRESPLGKLCQQCDWWILFKRDEEGNSPYIRVLPLPAKPEPREKELMERPGVFDLKEAIVCNTGRVTPGDSVCITTPSEQWAFAAALPLHDDARDPVEDYGRMVIRVEATVEEGRIGLSVVSPDKSELISKEDLRAASPGRITFEVRLDPPPPGAWLVIRNAGAGGIASKVLVHGITAYVASASPPVPAAPWGDPRDSKASDGFIPLEKLAVAKAPATWPI
jgi:pyruvate-formate lyase-activating enzyme